MNAISPFRFWLWTACDVAAWTMLAVTRGDSIIGWGLFLPAVLLLPVTADRTASRVATPREIFWIFMGLFAFIATMIWTLPMRPFPLRYLFHPAVVIPFVSGTWLLTYRRWIRARSAPLAA